MVLPCSGREGYSAIAEVRILDGPTWSAPTLLGTTLYVRDKQTIRALDLGRGRS